MLKLSSLKKYFNFKFIIFLSLLIVLSFSCINMDEPFSMMQISWSKNSKSFVYEKNIEVEGLDTYTGEIWSYNVKKREQKILIKRPGELLIRPVFSSDNKKIAFIRIKYDEIKNNENSESKTGSKVILEIINYKTLKTISEINFEIENYKDAGIFIFDILWSKNDEYIVLKLTNAQYNRKIYLINLKNKNQIVFESNSEKDEILLDPDFSKNDEYLYFSYLKKDKLILYKYNIKNDKKEKIRTFLLNDDTDLLYNQSRFINNCEFYIFNYNNDVILYDIKKNIVKKIFSLNDNSEYFYIPSKNGKYVIYYYKDEIFKKKNLIISKNNSNKIHRLAYFDIGDIVYTTLSWSPNNKYIVFKINTDDDFPKKGVYAVLSTDKKYANLLNYEDPTVSLRDFQLKYQFAEKLNKIGYYDLSNKILKPFRLNEITDKEVNDVFKMKYDNYMNNYKLIKANNLIKEAEENKIIDSEKIIQKKNELKKINDTRKELNKLQKDLFIKSITRKISKKEIIEIYIDRIAADYLEIKDYKNYHKSLIKAYKMMKKQPDNDENISFKKKYDYIEKIINELNIIL